MSGARNGSKQHNDFELVTASVFQRSSLLLARRSLRQKAPRDDKRLFVKYMPVSPKDRLLSLDVFRGVTIAGMVLVNNPGSWSYVYPPLEHAEWHDWTPTDLVFPFFARREFLSKYEYDVFVRG